MSNVTGLPDTQITPETTGKNLKWIRKTLLAMTLKSVSRQTGLSVSFLSNMERGQSNPSIETLKKLANCYNVPLVLRISPEADGD